MKDPIHELTHDHADLNRRVIELGTLVRGLVGSGTRTLAGPLGELREMLFLHFAREEEGLFPFVAETVSELSDQVQEMAVAHDTICGALARMCYLASFDADASSVTALFERFEQAYAGHAKTEADLFRKLDARLDVQQRRRIAALVAGL